MDVTNVHNGFYSDSMFPEASKPPIETTTLQPKKVDQLDIYKKEVEKEGQLVRILSQKEMENLVEDLNTKMSLLSNDLRFGFNDQVDMMEVTVINVKTDKVIRRFPTEEAVKLMSSMKEFLGLLFDEKG